MPRYLFPLFAFGLAVIAAILMATVAHDGLGVPRATIRTDALAAAAFILMGRVIVMKMKR
jgi:hypothetical protein